MRSILDLDGSFTAQAELLSTYQPQVLPAGQWGPRIRLACSFSRFRRFERELATWYGGAENEPAEPAVTFIGSGDFHHVSLALVRRQRIPINLLVIDNHPDWMRFVPFLHCGTWLYHAACLLQVERIFHVGGDVDFDNYYQWMAPWRLLRCGKIQVIPAIRRYERGAWSGVPNEPVRIECDKPATPERIDALIQPFRTELANRPLYISLDKDVMTATEAVVNWDSGHLTETEVHSIIRAFLDAAKGSLTGMDIVGDWSPVCVQGGLRRLMHWTMHPALQIDPEEATQRNQEFNLSLLAALHLPGWPKA